MEKGTKPGFGEVKGHPSSHRGQVRWWPSQNVTKGPGREEGRERDRQEQSQNTPLWDAAGKSTQLWGVG